MIQFCHKRAAIVGILCNFISKLTTETPEYGVKYVQSYRSGVFIVNFEHRISS